MCGQYDEPTGYNDASSTEAILRAPAAIPPDGSGWMASVAAQAPIVIGIPVSTPVGLDRLSAAFRGPAS